MLKTRNILATAAMTVLMAFAGQADAGHGGHGGSGSGGGGFRPQMSSGNMGMRPVGNFQNQHNVSNMQSNALKLQSNHSNVLSNATKLPNVQNSNIHLANKVNHNKLTNVLNSNGHNNSHGISLNHISNKGMNGQNSQSGFKQNSFKQICPPWGSGSGKYTGCWGNYGGCYGSYGGCFGNYGGCYGNYGYGCNYPCVYTNWGYGCGDWGYTCGYYPRYYTCYSYPIVQPCPVVSCAYAPATQVVTTAPVTNNVVVNETAAPVGSLALSNVAIPPSPVP